MNVCDLNEGIFPGFFFSAELFRKQELDLFKFSAMKSILFTSAFSR